MDHNIKQELIAKMSQININEDSSYVTASMPTSNSVESNVKFVYGPNAIVTVDEDPDNPGIKVDDGKFAIRYVHVPIKEYKTLHSSEPLYQVILDVTTKQPVDNQQMELETTLKINFNDLDEYGDFIESLGRAGYDRSNRADRPPHLSPAV